MSKYLGRMEEDDNYAEAYDMGHADGYNGSRPDGPNFHPISYCLGYIEGAKEKQEEQEESQ